MFESQDWTSSLFIWEPKTSLIDENGTENDCTRETTERDTYKQRENEKGVPGITTLELTAFSTSADGSFKQS